MVLIVGYRFCGKLIEGMELKSVCVRKLCLISLTVFHGMLITESCINAAVNYAVSVCMNSVCEPLKQMVKECAKQQLCFS